MEFNYRTLNAQDIFPVCNIISKIGFNEFKDCFNSDEVKTMLKSKGNETVIGFRIALNIGGIILENLPKCQNELFSFLASVGNVDVDTVKNLPMGEFAEMIFDVVKKPEFKDFFKAVSKLFKSEN